MNLLAQQPYVKIERKIVGLEKVEVEYERTIYLYDDRVVTQNREFQVKDVMDFSYREIAGQGGILYLHARQGVYTYVVKSSPAAFITAYQKYFK